MEKKYFAYTRVSTVKQGRHGVSLQEQKSAIREYARRHSLKIGRWFEDCETAAKQGRKMFSRMMALLRRGKARGVVIHKIDRSARNLRDWADLGELSDQDIDVRFVSENLDLSSLTGRLSADMHAVFSAHYIRNLREEAAKGIYGRLKQGLYPMPAPVGYLNAGRGKPKVADPKKAPLVRKVFELYSSGGYSLEMLLKEARRLGLTSRSGGRLSRNGLSNMLKNPFYIGLIRIKKTGDVYPGVHAPIVRKAVYDRVQEVISGKAQKKVQKHDFLYRRLFRCGGCSKAVTGEIQKKHVYYRCHRKDCPVTGIREEVADQAVLSAFAPLELSEEEQAYAQRRIEAESAKWLVTKDEQLKAVQLEIGKAKERLARYSDAFVDGTIDREIFEERKKALLMERAGLEENLEKLELNGEQSHRKLAKIFELAGSAYFSYKNVSFEKRRRYLEELSSNRVVEGKSAVVELDFPFDLMAKQLKNSDGGPSLARFRTLDALIARLAKILQAEQDKALNRD